MNWLVLDLPLAHAVVGVGGIALMIVLWAIAAALDDGSRYLCPRCGANLRPYVKSCRFCRARFKVEAMTPPTRGRRVSVTAAREKLRTTRLGPLPDPETLKACFELPAHDYEEPDITADQRRQIEALGATNLHAVDGLGRNQAAYLIKFRQALQRSEEERAHPASSSSHLRWWAVSISLAAVCAIVFAAWLEHDKEVRPEMPAKRASTLELTPQETAEPRRAPTAATLVQTQAATPPSNPSFTPSPVVTVAENRVRDEKRVDWILHGLPGVVKASQERALAKYPALSRPGSELSNAFVEFYRDSYSRHDSILYLNTWPEIIADECDGHLHPTPTPMLASTPEPTETENVSVGDSSSGGYGSQYVNGYYRKDGTYVHGYTRGGGGGHGRR